MPRKTTFGSDNESDASDTEDQTPHQDSLDLSPRSQPQSSTLQSSPSQSNGKKRAATNGVGREEEERKPKKIKKKNKLVGFTESDEEESAAAHHAQVNGTSQSNGIGDKGKKRVLVSNEEKKRLREIAKRLEGGRRELPVWEGE